MKNKPSGIHPTYKCTKSQHDCYIFYLIRLQKWFKEKLAQKNRAKKWKIFEKKKNRSEVFI